MFIPTIYFTGIWTLSRLDFFFFYTAHEPQIYLFLRRSGVCDDLPVYVYGTSYATEQETHRQAGIHKSHAGSIQKAGQDLRNR